MITLHTRDQQGIYSHSGDYDPYGPLPNYSTVVAPPALAPPQVAQWNGSEWAVLAERPPQPPLPLPLAPKFVTMRQARLALLGAGLLPLIDSTIASLPEPDRTAAGIEWEYSQEVQRHNGFVAMLGPMLGLDKGQLDALFILAATL